MLSDYETRTERFVHADFAVEMLLPRSADELIDVTDFDHDERLPYWADLWPSALALARYLLDAPLPAGRVLELGSGVALPSLALAWRGARVLATDYYDDALGFARLNAERNGLPPLETRLFDWRDPPDALGRFDLAIAADVAYERRNAVALAAVLPRLIAPGGRVLVADPGRIHFPDLRDAVVAEGWSAREVATREEPASAAEGARSRVSIVELRPPG